MLGALQRPSRERAELWNIHQAATVIPLPQDLDATMRRSGACLGSANSKHIRREKFVRRRQKNWRLISQQMYCIAQTILLQLHFLLRHKFDDTVYSMLFS